MTQSRVTNIPLFILFELLLSLLGSLNLSRNETTMAFFVFQSASFFAFGGSNAISSVDLSNAYNSVDSYAITTVGILTFCSNWAGPLWWMSATNLFLLKDQYKSNQRILFEHLTILTALNIVSNLAVMLACTLLRTHLFIWTVFSPKYLYSIAWSVGQHFCINIVAGSLLFWINHW